MGMLITEASIQVDIGGRSQSVSVSTTHAESTPINASYALVYPSVDVFVRQGKSPAAVSDGTDIALVGGAQVRLTSIEPGNKLSFITATGTGTVLITPGV